MIGVEAREHEGNRTVAGDIARGAEAVLQCKNREHEGNAGFIEEEDPRDESEARHDGAAGDAGCADGEDAE